MPTPHKHRDLIIQWANGAEIQFNTGDGWYDCIRNDPAWELNVEYRIKPEEKKPVVRWLWAYKPLHLTDGYIISGKFYSDEEKPIHCTIKLEWSRTEFPE